MARHLKRHGPNRRALLQAHEERWRDARVLFRAGRWAGAVYMAGYVVECLLKAALVSRRGLKVLPKEYWQHDLRAIASAAGVVDSLKRDRDPAPRAGLELLSNHWNVSMRYEGTRGDRNGAGSFLHAARS